jgi:hypothetical protein
MNSHQPAFYVTGGTPWYVERQVDKDLLEGEFCYRSR